MFPVVWLASRIVFRSGLVATEEGVVADMAGVSLSPPASKKVKTNEYHRLYTARRVQPRQALLSPACVTTQHKKAVDCFKIRILEVKWSF